MESSDLSPDLTVEDVLQKWPETAVVFQKYADACVGCTLAAFCTIEEVANEYDVDLETLLQAIKVRIDKEN